MIKVTWLSGVSKGYSDLFPDSWFELEGAWVSREHAVIGPRDFNKLSRCSIVVAACQAELDYSGQHESFNKDKHYIGKLRIVFSDSRRRVVRQVEWCQEGYEDFAKEDVHVSYEPDDFSRFAQFDPRSIEDGRQWIAQMVVLRQGQPIFRAQLLETYGRKCAITGCEVEDVLEAAHIVPYQGPQTNDVTNGLLLRADIHTLFDRGLIRIDEHYKILVDTAINRQYNLPASIPYLPSDETKWPSREALALKYANVP